MNASSTTWFEEKCNMFRREILQTTIVVARGCGSRTGVLDADRRSGAMGRRRNAGLRPGAFAQASESIRADDRNGRTPPSARNGHRPFVGAANIDVVPRGRRGYDKVTHTRPVSIMLCSHPLESPSAPATPSITATEFAAWLIAPKAIGPCPWSAGRAEPSMSVCRRAQPVDEAVASILQILNEIES